MNPMWFVIAVELDFYRNIDKLLRDNFKYVQCCLLCMIESVSEMCPSLINQVTDAFQKMIENKGTLPLEKSESKPSLGVLNVISRGNKEFGNLSGSLLLMLSFHEMLKSSSFK